MAIFLIYLILPIFLPDSLFELRSEAELSSNDPIYINALVYNLSHHQD